jgi:hypothetical protein
MTNSRKVFSSVATALKSAFWTRWPYQTVATRCRGKRPRCRGCCASKEGRRRAWNGEEAIFPIISSGALRAMPRGPRCPRNVSQRCVAGEKGVATRCDNAKESMLRKTMKCLVTNIAWQRQGCAQNHIAKTAHEALLRNLGVTRDKAWPHARQGSALYHMPMTPLGDYAARHSAKKWDLRLFLLLSMTLSSSSDSTVPERLLMCLRTSNSRVSQLSAK